jgi:hypothetical protein
MGGRRHRLTDKTGPRKSRVVATISLRQQNTQQHALLHIYDMEPKYESTQDKKAVSALMFEVEGARQHEKSIGHTGQLREEYESCRGKRKVEERSR